MNLQEAKTLIAEHAVDLIDLCPHCGANVHIEKLWSEHHMFKNNDVEFYVIFRCRPCKKLVLKTYYLKQNILTGNFDLKTVGWDEKFPPSFDNELSKDDVEYIPEQILSDYKEALKCKSISANRASCAMFRRSLQNGLVTLGADAKSDLITQINSLDSLPPDIKDWAHQIRIFGNWGAHPDKDQLKNVSEEDVAEVYDFITKFFTYTFIMPEKVKLSRKRREDKINGEEKKE